MKPKEIEALKCELLCMYEKPCSFKYPLKEGLSLLGCGFQSTCNQQARPYMINGVTTYLRQSDTILLNLIMLEHGEKRKLKKAII